MPSRTRILGLGLALLLAACGGGDKEDKAEPKTTTTSSSTTAAAPTEGTLIAADAAPLTGLPQPDASRRGRIALAVKYDNAPKARPQQGINQADVVYSEKVEDGVTRFLAIFHSQDAGDIGPVRSARTTDIHLAAPLRRPLFAYSGTNATFQALIDKAPLVDVSPNKLRGAYRRLRGRPAPYDLWSSTGALWAATPDGSMPPPPLFAYRAAGEAAAGEPAAGVHVEYLGKHINTIVDYDWDPAVGGWKRAQDGGPHNDTAGRQVAPPNLVVMLVEYVDTGQRDRSGSVVPEAKLIGEGEAWVLTDGRVVKGRWRKEASEAAPTFTTPDGRHIRLTPGPTWVELAPVGQARLK